VRKSKRKNSGETTERSTPCKKSRAKKAVLTSGTSLCHKGTPVCASPPAAQLQTTSQREGLSNRRQGLAKGRNKRVSAPGRVGNASAQTIRRKRRKILPDPGPRGTSKKGEAGGLGWNGTRKIGTMARRDWGHAALRKSDVHRSTGQCRTPKEYGQANGKGIPRKEDNKTGQLPSKRSGTDNCHLVELEGEHHRTCCKRRREDGKASEIKFPIRRRRG